MSTEKLTSDVEKVDLSTNDASGNRLGLPVHHVAVQDRLVSKLPLVLCIIAVVLLGCRTHSLECRIEQLETAALSGDRWVAMNDESQTSSEAGGANFWHDAEVQPPAASNGGVKLLASDMDHDKWENPRETEDDEQVGGSQYPFNDLAAAAGHNDSATHSRAKRSASGQTGRPKSVADGAQKTTRRPPKGAKRPPVTTTPASSRNPDVAMVLTMDVPTYESEFKSGQSYIYRAWRVADWAQNSQLYEYRSETGRVIVKKKGVYYVFAQLLYHNAATRSCYVIKTSDGNHGVHNHHALAKCWSSVDVVESGDPARFKTCHVSIAVSLEQDQPIWIEDPYGNFVRPDADSNFFGIFKLADL